MHRANHRLRIGRVAAQAALCLALTSTCRASSNAVPDWVKAAAQQPLPTLPESTKAVVLLNDETYTVDEKGQAVEHVRRVIKILRPQGREDAYPVVEFDKDSKVLSFHAWSIDPAGHEYAVKDNEMAEVSPPGEGKTSTTRTSRRRSPTHRVATPAVSLPGSTNGASVRTSPRQSGYFRTICRTSIRALTLSFRPATPTPLRGRTTRRSKPSIWSTRSTAGR